MTLHLQEAVQYIIAYSGSFSTAKFNFVLDILVAVVNFTISPLKQMDCSFYSIDLFMETLCFSLREELNFLNVIR
jgi:hypothetical protein